MKLPRDVRGIELVKALRRVGYVESRQRGDHVHMITHINGEHHLTVRLHDPIKVGTLSAIVGSAASHLCLSREELIAALRL